VRGLSQSRLHSDELPFLDRAGWEKSVRKMIDVMGAPVDEKDVPEIIDYLTRSYGK
jgi:hypothetical protein